MALNVDKLQAGLEDYQVSLSRSRENLQSNFNDIQMLFEALFAAYAGQMAEEFRQHWSHSAEWFEEYLETGKQLDQFLESRIQHLRDL